MNDKIKLALTQNGTKIDPQQFTKDVEKEIISLFYEALPTDTYLKRILAGFPDYCAKEIDNDWGMNPLETANELRDKLEKKGRELDKMGQSITAALENRQKLIEDHVAREAEIRTLAGEHYKRFQEAAADADRLEQVNFEQREALGNAKAEILDLKAKLYDYITKFGLL